MCGGSAARLSRPARRRAGPPESPAVLVVAIVFWACAALIVYTQLGYGVLLALLAGVGREGVQPAPPADAELPSVSLVVAAYKEEAVIAEKVANVRALDYPADKLELIVACDGSPDATPQRAREAGADIITACTHN